MTGRWLTLTATAARISAATGQPVFVHDVLALGESQLLTVRMLHDHHSVLEESVDRFIASLASSEPDALRGALLAEHADKPSVGGGPDLPADIEDEYRKEKGT